MGGVRVNGESIKRKRGKCWREFFCSFKLPFFSSLFAILRWTREKENRESEEIFTVISCNLNSTFRALYWLSLAFLKSFKALNKEAAVMKWEFAYVCRFPFQLPSSLCAYIKFFSPPLFTLPAMPFLLIVLYCI